MPRSQLCDILHNMHEKNVALPIINRRDIESKDVAHYPGSDELHSIGSPLARHLGLKQLGIHHEILPPGRRSSWPHAESHEEEFVYVIEGEPHVWLDGHLHQLKEGDAVGFPSGTGIGHTIINNSTKVVRLLVVGEANKPENKCHYHLHSARNIEIGNMHWKDCPLAELGPHDGLPDKLRK